jgi:hypothetical protein
MGVKAVNLIRKNLEEGIKNEWWRFYRLWR